MPATIKDVAAVAGTSITTVSKVLNNREMRVSEETRRRVIDAARMLEYTPNSSAVRLKGGRVGTVAVILPNISGGFFNKLASQLIKDFGSADYDTLIFDTTSGGKDELHYLYALQRKIIDGAVVMPSPIQRSAEFDRRAGRIIDALSFPAVVVDDRLCAGRCPGVATDSVAAGRLAAEHLCSLGHRRLGFLSQFSNPEEFSGAYAGFRAAAEEFGAVCSEFWIHRAVSTYQQGYAAAEFFSSAPATAVFAESDSLAIGLAAGLKARGIGVPADMSVMGYDDMFVGRILDTPLTTVRRSVKDISSNVVSLLLAGIDRGADKPPAERVILTPELIVRGTTAPPKS